MRILMGMGMGMVMDQGNWVTVFELMFYVYVHASWLAAMLDVGVFFSLLGIWTTGLAI